MDQPDKHIQERETEKVADLESVADALRSRRGLSGCQSEASDPVYERFDLALFKHALNEAWAEPARRFPYFCRSRRYDRT